MVTIGKGDKERVLINGNGIIQVLLLIQKRPFLSIEWALLWIMHPTGVLCSSIVNMLSSECLQFYRSQGDWILLFQGIALQNLFYTPQTVVPLRLRMVSSSFFRQAPFSSLFSLQQSFSSPLGLFCLQSFLPIYFFCSYGTNQQRMFPA